MRSFSPVQSSRLIFVLTLNHPQCPSDLLPSAQPERPCRPRPIASLYQRAAGDTMKHLVHRASFRLRRRTRRCRDRSASADKLCFTVGRENSCHHTRLFLVFHAYCLSNTAAGLCVLSLRKVRTIFGTSSFRFRVSRLSGTDPAEVAQSQTGAVTGAGPCRSRQPRSRGLALGPQGPAGTRGMDNASLVRAKQFLQHYPLAAPTEPATEELHRASIAWGRS